ncbi:hypothetical protein SAMN06264364_12183 [Quadrisphaera granulorum]|uniref:DUF4288 domain-containing protein n=1 Tax=Quadrisphaera granulorum TaxID=317664 RepID=A0A315ZZW6_9ACTN|nr:hypothetical protein [Quadrisphaera granulorum]PWJ51206.1 hypothetical protein BXY45_12183 [Quadrisphaera granulorum]SZE97856.1 hypothetical protein SAMN06264364_12183 [Quadrisphaera granulorum]
MFRFRDAYEERFTVWRAESMESAMALAEAEALEYARESDAGEVTFLGLLQGYRMEGEPGHGAEVFSLVRSSDLGTREYLDRFFDTGDEHQSVLRSEAGETVS